MNGVEFALGAGAAVLLLAVLAVRVSTRLGLPSLLVYLAIGLLIGESGLGFQFSDTPLTAALGIAGLVLILAEGGLTTVTPCPSLRVWGGSPRLPCSFCWVSTLRRPACPVR